MPKKQKKIVLKESKFVNFTPIDKSVEAALYYGFNSAKQSQTNKEDIQKANSLKESWVRNCQGLPWISSQDFIEERIALLREYAEKNMSSLPQPVMIAYESNSRKERGKTSFNLEVIGTQRSIAEALLIKAATAILEDNGYKNITLEINSIGDKESLNKFSKDLTNYFKKSLNELSAHCRQNFKKDPFYVLSCNTCECTKTKEGAPTSISCLSDASRLHFKEVLEYVEIMGIPFEINNFLVPDKKYCSQTIFEIKNAENKKEVLAIGFRYDGLTQKLGIKKEIPGAGIKIILKKKTNAKKISKLPKPQAFYIQLGDEAKHRSLEVIEMLRKEKIYVYQMLGRDKFGSQFSLAEKMKVPYVIIMGKKNF